MGEVKRKLKTYIRRAVEHPFVMDHITYRKELRKIATKHAHKPMDEDEALMMLAKLLNKYDERGKVVQRAVFDIGKGIGYFERVITPKFGERSITSIKEAREEMEPVVGLLRPARNGAIVAMGGAIGSLLAGYTNHQTVQQLMNYLWVAGLGTVIINTVDGHLRFNTAKRTVYTAHRNIAKGMYGLLESEDRERLERSAYWLMKSKNPLIVAIGRGILHGLVEMDRKRSMKSKK